MKIRLDVALVEQGIAPSRDKAKAIIMSGKVFVDNQVMSKPGDLIEQGTQVEHRGNPLKYVSRGGLKLEKAVDVFALQLEGKICADFGASTGGFTDCMLQNGAEKVYAVDVGYGQLAWALRTDKRVVNYERTNIRHLKTEEITDEVSFVSIDVSFISLGLILPVAYKLLGENGQTMALIKPQFEAGREKVGKKGVVKDKNVHAEVIEKVVGISKEIGFEVAGLDFSPITGPEGNIEYLILFNKQHSGTVTEFGSENIKEVVDAAHASHAAK